MPQKGKHRPPQRKEKKTPSAAPIAAAQTTAQKTVPAAATTTAPVKVAGRSTPQTVAAFTQARYPFIGSEIKMIGIIAAVIVIVLVILAFVLPPMLS